MKRLRDASGFTVAEALVSALVNMLAIGLIGTAIVAFTVLNLRMQSTVAAVSNAAIIDASLRSDASSAVKTSVTETSVTFREERSDRCVTKTYTVGADTLTVDTLLCTGEQRRSQTFDLSPDSAGSLTFTNPAGRAIAVVAGELQLETAADPGVDGWDSEAIGSVTLDVVFTESNTETAVKSTVLTSPASRVSGTAVTIDTELVEAPDVP